MHMKIVRKLMKTVVTMRTELVGFGRLTTNGGSGEQGRKCK